jgi:hypothetical protein
MRMVVHIPLLLSKGLSTIFLTFFVTVLSGSDDCFHVGMCNTGLILPYDLDHNHEKFYVLIRED